MRRAGWIGIVAAGLLLGGCDAAPGGPDAATAATGTTQPGVPTIVLDSQHQLRQQGDAGQPYLLSAASGVVLDASRFPLRDPQRRARMANTIRIIYDNSIFRAPWPQGGRQTYPLDRSTLIRVSGDEFDGFKPGTQTYIAIGYQEGGSVGAGEFIPFWMTSVIFR